MIEFFLRGNLIPEKSSFSSIVSRLVDCIYGHGHWVLTVNYVEGSLEVFELIF
jgi:hypothetical protein